MAEQNDRDDHAGLDGLDEFKTEILREEIRLLLTKLADAGMHTPVNASQMIARMGYDELVAFKHDFERVLRTLGNR